jgi:hypothetical protein
MLKTRKIQPNIRILAETNDNIHDLPIVSIIEGEYDLFIKDEVESNQMLILDSINPN